MDAHSGFAGKGRVGPDFFLCCLAGMEQSLSEDFLSFSDPLARKSRFWRGGPYLSALAHISRLLALSVLTNDV